MNRGWMKRKARLWERAARPAAFAFALVALGGIVRPAADAALNGPERALLHRYLDALQQGRYDVAFSLLSEPERHYFGSAANYASVFAADRLRIASYRVLGSSTAAGRGTVAIVSERIAFFDPAHQATGSATAKVVYGIVPGPHGPRMKDPYHPWRAITPTDLSATVAGVRASVRKISFYTGRLEIVVTFQNFGDTTVTLLPYGRSAIRDDGGRAYTPVATRLPGLTDKTLFTGLRLPASGQYTGLMTFLTPDRYRPKSIAITFAPALLDGGDAPFELALRAYSLPP